MANKQLMNKKLLIYRFMITLKLEIDKLYLLPSLRKNYKGNEKIQSPAHPTLRKRKLETITALYGSATPHTIILQ